jgi:hypothetical protein
MLDDSSFNPPISAVFHEDAQTYYGNGWYGQKALWQMIVHHGVRQPYQEKPPTAWDNWDELSHSYWRCCNTSAWIGEGLAALLMGGKAAWNHNAFFDSLEDWMRKADVYAAARQGFPRPTEETKSLDRFVDAFWTLHRDEVPAQPDGVTDLKWDVNKSDSLKWVPNPKPE